MPKQNRKQNLKSIDLTCKKATSLIIDYLKGELDPEIALLFEEHLSICPDCVAFLSTYKKTVFSVQSFYKSVSTKKLDKSKTESIKEKISSKPSHSLKS